MLPWPEGGCCRMSVDVNSTRDDFAAVTLGRLVSHCLIKNVTGQTTQAIRHHLVRTPSTR
jgi:hypothetical protein